MPVAVNCSVPGKGTVGDCGDIAIETSVGTFTVRLADPMIELFVAEMDAVPGPAADASPCVPAVLLTLATVFEELHVDEVVRSRVLPSL